MVAAAEGYMEAIHRGGHLHLNYILYNSAMSGHLKSPQSFSFIHKYIHIYSIIMREKERESSEGLGLEMPIVRKG